MKVFLYQVIILDLLKWYGMYPHVNSEGLEDKKYFMKRIKLVDTK